jgi:hypothetical protein
MTERIRKENQEQPRNHYDYESVHESGIAKRTLTVSGTLARLAGGVLGSTGQMSDFLILGCGRHPNQPAL